LKSLGYAQFSGRSPESFWNTTEAHSASAHQTAEPNSLGSKTPRRALMTTRAYREIITAKRALSVMARHTAKPAPRVMIQRLWCCHFVSLPTAQGAMTIVTAQTLVSVVLLVAESDFESACHLTCASEPPRLVAHTARRDISIA
jgi:hypothetical protein